MRTALVALLTAVAILTTVDVAQSHRLKQRCHAKMSLAELHRCQHRALHHAVTAQRFLERLNRRDTHLLRAADHRAWKAHNRQEQWLRRELAETHKRMRPKLGVTSWFLAGILCIHRGEGAWDANTGNGYYGGLQMDLTFQRSYGAYLLLAKGTANRWTPAEQIQVAYRAYASGRGWFPWPTTAKACGLI